MTPDDRVLILERALQHECVLADRLALALGAYTGQHEALDQWAAARQSDGEDA